MNLEATLLEHEREIAQLQTEVSALNKAEGFLESMIERNTQSNEKLSETLLEVEKSMTAMSAKMDSQTEAIESIKNEMEYNNKQVNERISTVKKQIDCIDNEGKFNIRTFIQKYLSWIIVLLGFGIFLVEKYIKF